MLSLIFSIAAFDLFPLLMPPLRHAFAITLSSSHFLLRYRFFPEMLFFDAADDAIFWLLSRLLRRHFRCFLFRYRHCFRHC